MDMFQSFLNCISADVLRGGVYTILCHFPQLVAHILVQSGPISVYVLLKTWRRKYLSSPDLWDVDFNVSTFFFKLLYNICTLMRMKYWNDLSLNVTCYFPILTKLSISELCQSLERLGPWAAGEPEAPAAAWCSPLCLIEPAVWGRLERQVSLQSCSERLEHSPPSLLSIPWSGGRH
jgi:hypothetical protein